MGAQHCQALFGMKIRRLKPIITPPNKDNKQLKLAYNRELNYVVLSKNVIGALEINVSS